ncbi:nucleoside-diphosphate-sugar epimerase [Nonlabens dokdonensis]|jgi:nucleoside-diphosphate-sugar epimerase|uniref:Nucleoside-diphosphate-sugar epimerase n=2 Tax=Nonlabens dokdonensis TaxID=328515 RepID=L7W3P0_NONDD|nr:NAD-dependent epimerase/dehydratase family protein [Nonlabens dokdonensis]AGC76185.1 nucleoside-diphosphate-sugar epimerase [Nonlabens dokdonensis DSW-6]PZX43854.1 nucleoside-diphosphate-sugar epimerase [Nonlabens dokdonensis]
MILITGATGLVGGHLLYRFRESGKNITATYRDINSLDKTREIFESYKKGASTLVDSFQWIQADILEIPSLEKAMQNVRIVYHCAAAVGDHSFEEIKNINMRGTENVVNVALSSGVKKLCHVSSIAALGDPIGEKEVNEEDFFNLDGLNTNYAITKFGAEMEAWRATQENLEVIIVNPGIILGEGNWENGSGQFFSKTASGNNYYTKGSSGFIDVRDVTKLMETLVGSSLKNERFILVAENRSFKSVLDKIATSIGKKKPKFLLNKPLLITISYLLKILNLLGFKRKLSTAKVESLTSKTNYSNSKVIQATDFEFTPIDETIERIAAFYKSRN